MMSAHKVWNAWLVESSSVAERPSDADLIYISSARVWNAGQKQCEHYPLEIVTKFQMIDKRTDFPVATSVQKMNGTDFAGMSQKESWTGTTSSASEIYLTEVQWNKKHMLYINLIFMKNQ